MSKALKNIDKYLERNPGSEKTPGVETLVLLSDSKGSYLKSELDTIKLNKPEIVWATNPGKTTEQGADYLDRKLKSIAENNGKTLVGFWYGTCDITIKQGQFIFQRYKCTEDLMNKLRESYKRLVTLQTKYDNVNIGILEIPPIFTKEWNRHKDYEFVDLISDDKINEQVSEANKLIRQFNKDLDFQSPQFECDFVLSHRKKKKSTREVETKTRYVLSSALLKDGVHPIPVVARKWLHKIINTVLTSQPATDRSDIEESGPSQPKKPRY